MRYHRLAVHVVTLELQIGQLAFVWLVMLKGSREDALVFDAAPPTVRRRILFKLNNIDHRITTL